MPPRATANGGASCEPTVRQKGCRSAVLRDMHDAAPNGMIRTTRATFLWALACVASAAGSCGVSLATKVGVLERTVQSQAASITAL